jgi:hypothetical protein
MFISLVHINKYFIIILLFGFIFNLRKHLYLFEDRIVFLISSTESGFTNVDVSPS